ncbi:hypothetical protein [Nocardia rhamnosiphila]
MNITEETAVLVREELTRRLADVSDLVGVSCIARGADSVFARAVLELGGGLEVVLPSRNYREAKVKPDHAPAFDELVARASEVRVMDFEEAGREAYEAANEALVSTPTIRVSGDVSGYSGPAAPGGRCRSRNASAR